MGKTTALRRIARRPSVGRVVPTVAIEFYAADLEAEGKTFRLHFWDSCTYLFDGSGATLLLAFRNVVPHTINLGTLRKLMLWLSCTT